MVWEVLRLNVSFVCVLGPEEVSQYFRIVITHFLVLFYEHSSKNSAS